MSVFTIIKKSFRCYIENFKKIASYSLVYTTIYSLFQLFFYNDFDKKIQAGNFHENALANFLISHFLSFFILVFFVVAFIFIFKIGYNRFILSIIDGKETSIFDIFYGYKQKFFRNYLTLLFILFLFMSLGFLLVIPGLCFMLLAFYSLFICADEEGLSPYYVVKRSIDLVLGNLTLNFSFYALMFVAVIIYFLVTIPILICFNLFDNLVGLRILNFVFSLIYGVIILPLFTMIEGHMYRECVSNLEG